MGQFWVTRECPVLADCYHTEDIGCITAPVWPRGRPSGPARGERRYSSTHKWGKCKISIGREARAAKKATLTLFTPEPDDARAFSESRGMSSQSNTDRALRPIRLPKRRRS